MIRKLVAKDHQLVMDYISKEKEFNLFMIGDIENFGYDTDFQSLWGEFDEKGHIKGVLLKFYENRIFYSDSEDLNKDGFISLFGDDFKVLSGKSNMVDIFYDSFNFRKRKDAYFCKIEKLSSLPEISIDREILRLNETHTKDIVHLTDLIDEFGDVSMNEERVAQKFITNTGRAYGVYDKDKLVAIAQTTAENSFSAMIVGVCTHPEYRNHGYASSCMIKLCSDLINEDKTLCLFYDNPKAGSIYKRLGFKDIGSWSMCVKE
ncbi:GNAT family N-acetyltransferase [Clostridium sp. D2Q-11]|uniref:GNAT family N-acetyltransferase n=1 Tax=Anaeromonas frigoriresistens TaxID=2683708 RepID=A0A942UPI7_9FIRM|nr:GNAT family N-acetyltransferase [Anaeromonas frigoriresistens]MBS4536823.1 GNAT family N-acetyltransferase [Anaeromonas frigoriresistens]